MCGGKYSGCDGYREYTSVQGCLVMYLVEVISPMDGVGPSDLQIQTLVERVEDGGVREVILALSPTMEEIRPIFIFTEVGKCSRTYQRDCTWGCAK